MPSVLKRLFGKRSLFVILILAAAIAFVRNPPQPRPVALEVCAVPRDLDDGLASAKPESRGFDPGGLCSLIKTAAAENLNIHAVLVERGSALIAEQYLPGVDASIWTLRPYRQDFGPADQHDLRSISKSIVGLLFGIAASRGKIGSLDTPVLDFFPELQKLRTPERLGVTLRHVLTMSTGLAWSESVATYGTFANDETRLFWDWNFPQYVLRQAAESEPGKKYNYNGGNTALLAAIIERQTGASLASFAESNLFAPIGITNWRWVNDPWGRAISFAGLRMTPRDLAKVGRMMLDGGRWQGKQIVPAEWIEISFSDSIRANASFDYGYQWYSGTLPWRGQTLRWHGAIGNGGQRLFLVPALDLTVAIAAGAYNSPVIGPAIAKLFREIAALAAE